MEYVVFAALVAAQFKRHFRDFLYGIVGVVLFLVAIAASVWGGISFLELSKLELLLLLGIFFVSSSNTVCDSQVNKEWFLSDGHEVNGGWLYSKYTDFIWIGLLPFYFFMLGYAGTLLNNVSETVPLREGDNALFNSTTISAVLLVYFISVLIMRNVYLRIQLSRLESDPSEVTSESTKKEEVSNG